MGSSRYIIFDLPSGDFGRRPRRDGFQAAERPGMAAVDASHQINPTILLAAPSRLLNRSGRRPAIRHACLFPSCLQIHQALHVAGMHAVVGQSLQS